MSRSYKDTYFGLIRRAVPHCLLTIPHDSCPTMAKPRTHSGMGCTSTPDIRQPYVKCIYSVSGAVPSTVKAKETTSILFK